MRRGQAKLGGGREIATTSTAPLISSLLTLGQIDAMLARGVNRQVLYQSATVLVESVLDPRTGLEVNQLTCVGNSWPDPPLAAVLRAEGDAT
jgi:hypothetical protein